MSSGIRHHGPGSARSVAEALDDMRPDLVLVEGPPELDPVIPLVADAGMVPPVARSSTPPTSRAGPRSTRSRTSPRSGWRSGGPSQQGYRSAPSTCRRHTASHCTRPARTADRRRAGDEPGDEPGRSAITSAAPYGPMRSRCWPRPPGTVTPSAGGRTPSSTARRSPRTVRGHYGRHRGRSAPWTTGTPDDPDVVENARREAAMRGSCGPPCERGTHESRWCAGPITPPPWSRRIFHRRRRTASSCAGLPKTKVRSRGCRGHRTGFAWKPVMGPVSLRPAGTSICSPMDRPGACR